MCNIYLWNKFYKAAEQNICMYEQINYLFVHTNFLSCNFVEFVPQLL
jgi:hypothetical protein